MLFGINYNSKQITENISDITATDNSHCNEMTYDKFVTMKMHIDTNVDLIVFEYL